MRRGRKPKNPPALAVYGGVTTTAIKQGRDAILDILQQAKEEKTKRVALWAFVKVMQSPPVTISHCSFTQGGRND